MTALALDRRFVLPRPGMFLLRAGLGAVVALPMAVWLVNKGMGPVVPLFCMLFVAAQVASALTTSHKEILASSPSFFHAGLRRKLWHAQVAWALGEAAAMAAFTALAYPSAGLAIACSAIGATLAAHALMALGTLSLSWSYQLPFWINYLFYFTPWLGRAERSGRLDGVLGAPVYWIAGGVILMWLLGRELTGPRRHRGLCGTLVLGANDMLRPSRIQEYRRQGDRSRRPGVGPRWRSQLIGVLVGRADVARQKGRASAARAWQLSALNAAINITPRVRVLVLILAATVGFMVFAGYYDARDHFGTLRNWFGGILYQSAAIPFYGMGVVLLSAPHGVLSRRAAFRAELGSLMWFMLAALAGALVIAAAFAALAAVLPPVTWRGVELAFVAPRLHGLWLVPMLGPLAWLTVALRPRPQCTLTNMLIGPGFIFGHAFLTAVPYATSVPVCAAVSLLAFASAYVLRRRWWARADLVH